MQNCSSTSRKWIRLETYGAVHKTGGIYHIIIEDTSDRELLLWLLSKSYSSWQFKKKNNYTEGQM